MPPRGFRGRGRGRGRGRMVTRGTGRGRGRGRGTSAGAAGQLPELRTPMADYAPMIPRRPPDNEVGYISSEELEKAMAELMLETKQCSNEASAGTYDDFDKTAIHTRTYSVQDKLADPRFPETEAVQRMLGQDFNYTFVQKGLFKKPVVIESKQGLHMSVPPIDEIKFSGIRAFLGSQRIIQVKDSDTGCVDMINMRRFHVYWEKKQRKKLLGTEPIELSQTKLDGYTKTPLIVRQLDWVERAWPPELRHMQTRWTNLSDEMTYPLVQKCLSMSVAGYFEDFRLEKGGATFWAHVMDGELVLFLIPPSKESFDKFIEWKASRHKKSFFGDEVKECFRVTVHAGETFFVPSAWLFAVYSSKDTVIFSGSFLHSFAARNQRNVALTEDVMEVPSKDRYPLLPDLLWFVLARYVYFLTGSTYICSAKPRTVEECNAVLSKLELSALESVMSYLVVCAENGEGPPLAIAKPGALVREAKRAITEHINDDPTQVVFGRPVLLWPHEKVGTTFKRRRSSFSKRRRSSSSDPEYEFGVQRKKAKPMSVKRRLAMAKLDRKRSRAIRCRQCPGCLKPECRKCKHCLDKPKYGGLGKMKQSCINRRCLNKIMPDDVDME